jgi:pimeloyl-ACP methyl ester carboxylesterase
MPSLAREKKMNRSTQNRSVQISRWLFLALAVALLGALIWGIRWATYARPPLPEAITALESDARVEVTAEPWLTFTPQTPPDTGFIFYPGGRIDPRGYASLMKALASEGYLAVVPKMPINMAAFRPNAATQIMAAHPEIDRWVIGGHSVGGVMAAAYTYKQSERIDGLAIWAAYPPGNANLSDLAIPVLSIYGSRETTVTDESVREREHLLPADTRYVRIEGGDHHQFGSYEIEPDEHRATVDRAIQHDQIIQQTLTLLETASETD